MTTEKVIKKRWNKKRLAVAQLAESIHQLRGCVMRDISVGNETALVVWLIMRTSERVGDAQSALAGHYGIAYLMQKHVTIKGSTVTLHYIAKSGVEQHKTIKDTPPTVLKMLKNCQKRKYYLFDTNRKKVNAYLAQFNITSKDIRGYNANDKVKNLIAKHPKGKVTPTQFRAILKTVAQEIGHQPATLKNHYLLPEVLKRIE